MFRGIDLAKWRQQMLEKMDQKLMEARKPPDKTKIITDEGRVYTPYCRGSVCSVCESQ
jgi:hypothetical protein